MKIFVYGVGLLIFVCGLIAVYKYVPVLTSIGVVLLIIIGVCLVEDNSDVNADKPNVNDTLSSMYQDSKNGIQHGK